MPFLSKKVKSARISQFVNDQFHNSRKNRLETGFPTSLIDLFIKNRSKLKTKKRRNPPISDFKDQISDSKDQIIVESPPSIDSPPRCPSPPLLISPPPSEISAVGCVDEIDGQDVKLHKVLFGVLKIFLVVVMALGSKKFVIGITISAFLLLLMEYVGRSIPTFSRFRDVELHERNNETKSLDQEIQEIEEIQLIDELNFENQESGDFLDKESGVIGSESRTKSRKSNIKSRMKKFVPKKFKTSRKKPDEEQADQGNSGESESIHSSVSSSSRMHGDEDPSARLREVTEETTTKIEEVEGGLTWRHLVLCLIVLIGLIGGRMFALVLTLSWFLLLKLGKYPRFMNKVHVKSL